MINAGIFGPKLSGKTTLAISLSKEHWRVHKLRSLVFDPHLDGAWGEQAWVSANEEVFWANVWKAQPSLIIVDEAAITIRRDKDLIPVFTAMRHRHHRLIVIGHSGMDLLPVMRQQLDTLYLFRQPESAGKVWCETFADVRLIECTKLKQFEFIKVQLYGDPHKMILER